MKQLSETEEFKNAVLSEKHPWLSLSVVDAVLTLTEKELVKFHKWNIVNKCRHCKLPVTSEDFVLWTSYWYGMWFPAHKECLQFKKQESIDCQTIDADCNDCKHFERGKRQTMEVSDGGKNKTVSLTGFGGYCRKLNKDTVAQPNFCSNHECFEHRSG